MLCMFWADRWVFCLKTAGVLWLDPMAASFCDEALCTPAAAPPGLGLKLELGIG